MPVRFNEAQLEAWVAEAEAGYDVEMLRERGKGCLGSGAGPCKHGSSVVDSFLFAEGSSKIQGES